MKKKGIALSGGGIKSDAQLPILKTFQEEGIVFDVVSGTSMGSAIAAIYTKFFYSIFHLLSFRLVEIYDCTYVKDFT